MPLLNQVLAILPDTYHQTVEQPVTVDETMICWPLGLQAKSQKSAACQQKKSAYLLSGMAPQTISDPMNQLFATEQLNLLLDVDSGLRVTPACASGATMVQQEVVWPLVLDHWLPKHQQREQILPEYHPNCQLTQSDHQLLITGIHDQAIIYPEVNAAIVPAVELALLGSSGINYWFLNGELLNQSSSELVLKDLSPGNYQLQVIDTSAQTAELSFAVRL